MFLRRCERRKSGKHHTYWALVESYRTAKGSRQRVVAYLGELKPTEQDGWAQLGAHLNGNTHDSTTVQTMIESLERKHGFLNRVWVMDRGMVSDANLKFLRERGGQYIVGTPKAMLRNFEQHLTDQDWAIWQEGVEVKLVSSPAGDETFLLARSADHRAKELAMHEKFTARNLGLILRKLFGMGTPRGLQPEGAASSFVYLTHALFATLRVTFWRAPSAWRSPAILALTHHRRLLRLAPALPQSRISTGC